MQFRSSKLIFVVKRLLKLGNLAQKVPHLQFDSFIIIFATLIQVENYSSEETIEGRKLHLINNPKMFNGETDDLAIKPCIPH